MGAVYPHLLLPAGCVADLLLECATGGTLGGP